MRATPTVRSRITLLATFAVLVVLILASLGLVAQQRRLLTGTLDESLEQRAGEIEALGESVPAELTALGEDDAVAQVVRDGEVIAASANVAGEPAVAAPALSLGTEIRTVGSLPHEDSAFRVLTRATPGQAIIVGGTLDDINESIATLVRSLVLAVPLVVVALAALLWWLVGRTLRPVESIRAEVAAIGGRDLHRRVPVPPGDDEIARLARTMNEMLDRVDEAAQRQQRFVADASHELRSPLARMRAELEVDLAHPEGADPAATHASLLEEAIGLQHLADDLLRVARADSGEHATTRAERVDLDDVVVRVVRRLRAADRVQVDLSAMGAGQVTGDPDQLARLVRNLADNAERHARSTVTFSLSERDGGVVLTVGDDGPGVPLGERDRIFEPFTRLDAARRSADGGTGLGLAIARDIAEAHGGSLELDGSAVEGARFVLRLSAAM
ncbi:MAG: HAMP domain-containing sensor histidine kinase [Acidimicrobiales bacterium]